MRTEDYDLTLEEVQELSSRDALAAFFARLGYDSNLRLVQNVSAMGITNDNLKATITHIERLAIQSVLGFAFEIYLFEVKSVTVATTQAIVRSFRNRPGDYLLVLTKDYQQLDFVLVERFNQLPQPQQDTPGITSASTKQVGVQPRVLTVNRRTPDPVALRVLRRFTCTESDTFAQYDKLISAYDVAYWSKPYFNNRALFSDYYLTERLPRSPEWDNAQEALNMTRTAQKLSSLYVDVRETFANQKEAVVRAKLLEPVLTGLGFTLRSMPAGGENTQPDYLLFADAAAARPLALCLAYTWNRNLDGKDETRDDVTPDENPGAAVVTLLDSGQADWAIVTNGKIWRLYSAKAHSRSTNYYEIDLEETLALPKGQRAEAFRYFWLLFRASAFITTERKVDGELREMCFLDWLMSESESYARKLGDKLKERVFDEIFPHFARGFILHARQTDQMPADLVSLPAEERNHLLEPYFNGTLIFLYRLLFLLYAESRDLLPVREVHGYYEHSLEKLKKRIAEKAGIIENASPARIKGSFNTISTALYDELQILFQAVDKGDASLNVPVYNGGLFITQPPPEDSSPEAVVATFLATHKIPDYYLALGLDRMARDIDDKQESLAFIDYKSLGVRQLGSIYEGLLEFKLRIAPEEMAFVKGKRTDEIFTYAEAKRAKLTIVKEGRGKDAPDKTMPKGAVYLENDRRERKATGSYYTPDYIVKYIVENTVGPVLTEKLEALRPIFREAEQTLRSKRDREKALQKQRLLTKGDTPENETYNHYRETLNVAFFDLKVLDPAMGSGHFLVEAVDYITDQMAKFLSAFKWNPVIQEMAETRREIRTEMERQGVTVDINKLTDLNLLKRRVLKSCIYGVDLNPMAVELAKVSLWLDCFTLGAPLSFLDHHMKYGNSLIGGNVQEVQDALSSDLWGSQFTYLLDATQLMRRVGELSDVTAKEVAESRSAYQGAYDALAPFKRLLDVWTSEYFGNKGTKHTTRLYANAIVANNYSKADQLTRKAIETALATAQEKRFFHWDLEFPEVFFDARKRKENGGFDAVVGNPPYGSQSNDVDKAYLSSRLTAVDKRAESYIAFVEIAHNQARKQGFVSLIVPDTWLTLDFTHILRDQLLRSVHILQILDLPNNVFSEATVDTTILVTQKLFDFGDNKNILSNQTNISRFLAKKEINSLEDADISSNINQMDWSLEPGSRFTIEVSNEEQGILGKLRQGSYKLDEICFINYGLKAYQEGKGKPPQTRQDVNIKAFSSNRQIDKTFLPFFEGEDIARFAIDWQSNNWLKYGKHLAEPRNFALFTGERLLYRKIVGKTLIGTIVVDDALSNTLLYIIKSKKDFISVKYVASILNSSLLGFFFRKVFCINSQETFPQIMLDDLKILPVHRISFTTPTNERARLLEKGKNLYNYCLTKNDQSCVTGFVDHHLSKEPEESDVVHDLLAFLAEEMIRLNKEKRAEQKEFLVWLETTLKILPDKDGKKGIDVLTGRGKIANYLGDYQKGEPVLGFEELLDILRKNKSKLGISLNDMRLVERLRSTYAASLEKVLPLKERLARTDALIDQVVYRLYGLTEEEIAVVEGKES